MSKISGSSRPDPTASPLHRRGNGSSDSFTYAPQSGKSSSEGVLPSPRGSKGMSVKKVGMNNPLSSKQAAVQSGSTGGGMAVPSTRKKPVVQKLTKPTSDDFFAEMGLSSSATSASTGGVVKSKNSSLSLMSDAGGGGADWGDDGDLDDLLDD